MNKQIEMTNFEICSIAKNYYDFFSKDDKSKLLLPIKVSFYLTKNINTIIELTKDIECARLEIIERYGKKSDDGTSYIFNDCDIETVNNNLKEIDSITQSFNIYTVSIDCFEDIVLNQNQIETIMFMIEE